MSRIFWVAFFMPFVRPALALSMKLVTDFLHWCLTPLPRVREVLFREM